jgi:hypothetical protein
MRPSGRLVLAVLAAAAALAACQSPPPVAETKPKRKSFEESNAWQPSTATASTSTSSGSATTDAQAQQVQQSWDQARQATSDAERQRAAGEALKQTRAMAEQPSSSGNQ